MSIWLIYSQHDIGGSDISNSSLCAGSNQDGVSLLSEELTLGMK